MKATENEGKTTHLFRCTRASGQAPPEIVGEFECRDIYEAMVKAFELARRDQQDAFRYQMKGDRGLVIVESPDGGPPRFVLTVAPVAGCRPGQPGIGGVSTAREPAPHCDGGPGAVRRRRGLR